MNYRKLKVANLFGLMLILLLAACEDASIFSEQDNRSETVEVGAPNLSQEEELSIICYRLGMRFEVCRDVSEQS